MTETSLAEPIEEQNQQDEAISNDLEGMPPDETEQLIATNPKYLMTQQEFSRCVVKVFQNIPFFAKISRYIRKIPTTQIETAGVTINPKTHELLMYWNPSFISSLKPEEISGLIIHEFFHIIFHHVSCRRRKPHSLWNYATDCAINSILTEMHSNENSKLFKLPECGIIPGKKPKRSEAELAKYKPEQREKIEFMDNLIASLPPMMSSEFYFSKFMEAMQKNPCMFGDEQLFEVVFGQDDHGLWSELSEEDKEKVEEKIRQMVSAAQKEADSEQNGWGSIPQSIQGDIRKYTSNIVNWRTVLQQFVGSLIRARKSSSFKRINKKYPWIHPGKKSSFQAKLLICVDQSGSVSDDMLATFASEVPNLNKLVEIDYLPFDCSASIDDVKTFQRGSGFNITRTKQGGTCFNAPSDVVNAPENAGRWDGYLILTDGYAPKPESSRVQRGWMLPKECTMQFETQELVIKIEEGVQISGAWR